VILSTRGKKTVIKGITLIVSVILLFGLRSAVASSPNWGSSTEHWTGLYFDGYVQCQPSYVENGQHAAQGWFVYRNGRDGEQWAYTPKGTGPGDTKILTASMRYYDSPEWDAPPVTWSYNFMWVPVGAEWPDWAGGHLGE
jgi:hypothetical protein